MLLPSKINLSRAALDKCVYVKAHYPLGFQTMLLLLVLMLYHLYTAGGIIIIYLSIIIIVFFVARENFLAAFLCSYSCGCPLAAVCAFATRACGSYALSWPWPTMV